MKRFSSFRVITISVFLLTFSFVSCSSDDDMNSSSGKGTAMAIINPDSGKKAKVNWVQLWKNGPKFAEYNLGVIDGKPESFGAKYQWYTFFDENDQISDFPWGDNWRVPTKEELEFLIESCPIEWTVIDDTQGLTVSGIGDFSDNSIFLPACDVDEGDLKGCYWSSTPEGLGNAYWLCFWETERWPTKVKYNGKHRYMSVRPVLVENKKDDKDSSDGLNSKLIGTWDGKITEDGVTFNAILVIKSNGSYFLTSESRYNNFGGEWTDKGNGTVTLTGFFDPTFKYSLNDDKLLFSGNGWSASFTRRH